MQEPINLTGQSVNGFLFTKKLSADAQSTCYLAQHDSGASYLIKHQEYPSPALLKGIASTGRNPEEYFVSRVRAMCNEVEQIKAVAQSNSHLSEPAELMVTRRAGGFPFDLFLCEKHREPLTQQIKQKGLTLGEGFKVAKDVLNGLKSMHAANVLHGNLSINSVFCGDQNTFVLGGYSAIRPEKENLASLSAGDIAMYMAPEVLAGEMYDKQSEVYAVGIMLYMLFNNNRLPYPDMQTAIRERMSNKIMPMPVRAPEAIGQVILRALTDRANRYPDAIAFLEALEQTQGIPAENAKMMLFAPSPESAMGGETTDLRKELGEMPPVHHQPPVIPVKPTVVYEEKPKKSRKGLVIALILVSVLLVGALTVGVLEWTGVINLFGSEQSDAIDTEDTSFEITIPDFDEIEFKDAKETRNITVLNKKNDKPLSDEEMERITFESSDEDIVLVSEDGVITPVDDGEATVKVILDGKEELEKCKIIVRIHELFEEDVQEILDNGNGTYGVYVYDLKRDKEYRWDMADNILGCSALVNIPTLYALNEYGYSYSSSVWVEDTYPGGKRSFTDSEIDEYYDMGEVVKRMLNNSGNDALNSLMNEVGVYDIQRSMNNNGFYDTSVVGTLSRDRQPGDPENQSTAYELGTMFKKMLQNNSYTFGGSFLKQYFLMKSPDREAGMGSELGDDYLQHYGETTSEKFNEIAYVNDGDKEFIIVFLSKADNAAGKNKNKNEISKDLAEYVYDKL